MREQGRRSSFQGKVLRDPEYSNPLYDGGPVNPGPSLSPLGIPARGSARISGIPLHLFPSFTSGSGESNPPNNSTGDDRRGRHVFFLVVPVEKSITSPFTLRPLCLHPFTPSHEKCAWFPWPFLVSESHRLEAH